MPNIISYEDFNSDGYSEQLNNQYRRSFPGSADKVINVRPGALCGNEEGMVGWANNIEEGFANFFDEKRTVLNTQVLDVLQVEEYTYILLGSNYKIKVPRASVNVGQSLFGGGYVERDGGELCFVRYMQEPLNPAVNKSRWEELLKIDLGILSADFYITGRLEYYEYNNSILISGRNLSGGILWEYKVRDNRSIEVTKERNSNIIIRRISTIYNASRSVDNRVAPPIIDMNNTLFMILKQGITYDGNKTIYQPNIIGAKGLFLSKSGWLSDNSPSTGKRVPIEKEVIGWNTDTNSYSVINGTDGNPLLETVDYILEYNSGDLSSVDPCVSYIIQPIYKDFQLSLDSSITVEDSIWNTIKGYPIVYDSFIADANWKQNLSNLFIAKYAGSSGTYQKILVFNIIDGNLYYYNYYYSGNNMYSVRFVKIENAATLPVYEELISSEVLKINRLDEDINIDCGNKKILVSALDDCNISWRQYTSWVTSGSSAGGFQQWLPAPGGIRKSIQYTGQFYTQNIEGHVGNNSSPQNDFNFVRVYRTVQDENAEGLQHNYIGDYPITNYTEETEYLYEFTREVDSIITLTNEERTRLTQAGFFVGGFLDGYLETNFSVGTNINLNGPSDSVHNLIETKVNIINGAEYTNRNFTGFPEPVRGQGTMISPRIVSVVYIYEETIVGIRRTTRTVIRYRKFTYDRKLNYFKIAMTTDVIKKLINPSIDNVEAELAKVKDFRMNEYAPFDNQVIKSLITYNMWSYSRMRPDFVHVYNNYLIFVKGSNIYVTQTARNGIVGETFFVDENRAIRRISGEILKILVRNDKIYVLTRMGLNVLESLSISVGDITETNGSSRYIYRGFKRNFTLVYESKYSFGNQMYISKDSTYYSINDYGEMIFEDGSLNDSWGYKGRFAGIKSLTWSSSLSRLLILHSDVASILDIEITCFIQDELYNGWYTYSRNKVAENYLIPQELQVLPRTRFIFFEYSGEHYLCYSNTTGINIVKLFVGNTDFLKVEEVYAQAEIEEEEE